MKKLLMMGAGVLLACLAIGPATASAAGTSSGEVIACLGAGTNEGAFQTQTIGTGSLGNIGITEPLCLFLKPSALSTTTTTLLNGLKGVKPPTTLPSQQDLLDLVNNLKNVQPGIFAALEIESLVCQAFHATDTCNNLTGTVLGAALSNFPLGTVTLQGNGEPCFFNKQTGTGTAFGPDFLELNWASDYSSLQGLAGIVSGSAHNVFEGKDYKINGIIGPECGAGVKALVLVVS
jgi:hypothetical protein